MLYYLIVYHLMLHFDFFLIRFSWNIYGGALSKACVRGAQFSSDIFLFTSEMNLSPSSEKANVRNVSSYYSCWKTSLGPVCKLLFPALAEMANITILQGWVERDHLLLELAPLPQHACCRFDFIKNRNMFLRKYPTTNLFPNLRSSLIYLIQ